MSYGDLFGQSGDKIVSIAGAVLGQPAASDLVFKGLTQPSGYTEPLLHAWRLKVKAGYAG